MEIIEKKVNILKTENNEFLFMRNEDELVVYHLSKGESFDFDAEDEESIISFLVKQKLTKDKEEAEDIIELLVPEEIYTLETFNEKVKEYAKNNKKSLTKHVFEFLITSEVTWINTSDAFLGPNSPKDYTFRVEADDFVEFYFPYQAELICEGYDFNKEEIQQIYDAYANCSYYKVINE